MSIERYGVTFGFLLLVQFGCSESSVSPLKVNKPSQPPEIPLTTSAAEFVDPPEGYTEEMLALQKEFKYSTGAAVAKLAEVAAKADRVILYEGLPHQGFEPKNVLREIRTKAVINLHEHPFYAEPLDFSDVDSRLLIDILKTRQAFKRFGGEKACGGYHPDYAVEFRAGDEVVRVLFCFGCGEAKIYALGIRSRHDLVQEDDFKAILSKYHRNRPERDLRDRG